MPTLIPTLTGKYIYDRVVRDLTGRANLVDADDILSTINDYKNALVTVLRRERKQYFVVGSQNSDDTTDTYFGPLIPTVREYTLPKNCGAISAIECLTDDLQGVKFKYRELTDPEFSERRRTATANPTSAGNSNFIGEYDILYTIIGTNTFMMAEWPTQEMQIRLWFELAMVPDVEIAEPLAEIISPYATAIAAGVTKHIMIIHEEGAAAGMAEEWAGSIRLVEADAQVRQTMTPRIVTEADV